MDDYINKPVIRSGCRKLLTNWREREIAGNDHGPPRYQNHSTRAVPEKDSARVPQCDEIQYLQVMA
jgi:hypothetical protein